MKFYKDKKVYRELLQLYFNKIKELFPNKYDDRLNDDLIEQMVNDEKQIELYEKSKEITDDYEANRDACSNFQKDLKVSVLHGISRATMDTFDRTKSKEENTEYIIKGSTTEGAIDIAKGYFDKLLNHNFFNTDLLDDEKVIEEYRKNSRIYNLGFVTLQMTNEIKDTNGSTEFNDLIKSIKTIFEIGGNYKSAVMTHGNPFSLVIPPFIEINDLSVLMSQAPKLKDEIVNKYGIEDFKVNNVPGMDMELNEYTNNFASKTNNKGTSLFEKELKKVGINSSKELIVDYKFFDKENKPIGLNELSFEISEGKTTFADYIMVKNTEEEKDKILGLFKNPYVLSLELDKNEKESLIVDTFEALAKAFPEKANELTKEKAIELMNDKDAITTYEKALNLKRQLTESRYIVNNLFNDNHISIPKELREFAACLTKGTRNGEFRAHNFSIAEKLRSRGGAQELINQEIEKLSSIDFTKCHFKNPKDYLDNFEAYKNIRMLRSLKSIVDSNRFYISNQFKDLINKNHELLESFDNYEKAINVYSNKISLFTPNIELKNEEDIKKFDKAVTDVFLKHKNNSTDFINKTEDDLKKVISDVAKDKNILDKGMELSNTILDEIEKGNVSKNVLDDNFIVDAEENHISTIEYFKEKMNNKDSNKYFVLDYSLKDKERIADTMNKPFMSFENDFLNHIINNKEDIVRELEIIENAKSVISFFDSKEYNNLKASISSFKYILANNDALTSVEEANKLDSKDAKTLSVGLLRALNNIDRDANAYITKKENQSKNETRQTRFDACKRLVENLSIEQLNEKYSIISSDNKVVGEEPLIVDSLTYPKSVFVNELEEENVDLNKSFILEEDEKTYEMDEQELADSITIKE